MPTNDLMKNRPSRIIGKGWGKWGSMMIWFPLLMVLPAFDDACTAADGEHEDTEQVQILYTADIHGVMRGKESGQGGALQLASLIRRRRSSFGSARTLLVDCGDTCQGSLVTALSDGGAGVAFLEELNYEVWVPGNHDFDFGFDRFEQLRQRIDAHVLAGNLRCQAHKESRCFDQWRLFSRSGVKLAIIGATARRLNHIGRDGKSRGYRIASLEQYLKNVLPEVLAEEPDVIVLALHQGYSYGKPSGRKRIRRTAKHFPAIDLILGGHTHRRIPGRRIGRSTWYVQAGAYANMLGVAVVTVNMDKGRISDVESRLFRVREDSKVDEKAETKLRKYLDKAQAARSNVLGRLKRDLSSEGVPGRSCGTSELISRAVQKRVDVDAAIFGRCTEKSLTSGKVTQADVFELIPYENRVVVVTLERTALVRILEEQRRRETDYASCGLYGLYARFNSDNHLRELKWPDGEIVSGEERLKVAFSSYTVAVAEDRFPELHSVLTETEARMRMTDHGTREVVKSFLEQHPGAVGFPVRRWIRTASE